MPKSQSALAHINIFTPKEGRLDAFIAAQLEGLPALAEVPELLGSQLYRANDGRHAIQIAHFADEAAHRSFMATRAFLQHRQRLLPLIEGTAPGYYALAYSRPLASD